MEIIETSVFTKSITELLPDDEYKMLQHYLISRPDAGAIVVSGGGLRKLRWSVPGHGKSGGVRIIYYWNHADSIYMLLCYQKNEQENLTPKQLSVLRTYIKDYLL